MKTYTKAKNIKIKFAGQVVTLKDESDRKKTSAGVEIWIQQQSAGNIRPMASIPDGTLEKYKHCRPEMISIQWE
jgi:hypothetical protein